LHCKHFCAISAACIALIFFNLLALSSFDWILSFIISTTIDLMADEKKIVDLALSGFYEALEKTNT
jgi:hypothetical protein